MTKLKNSNCGKTQKIILLQNSQTQIVPKLKNLNCDGTGKLKGEQGTAELASSM